ncbi:hypothetical protein R3P38DRAFT_2590146 [Favolaschia claudopus]|uniref:Uncharacterized protein n=1 Tax=Favolaschia claudopus TaxID=2862362 RepID=A0AAV9Z120_9AGAR
MAERNSKDRNRQDVSTVSNHLAIRGFHRMDVSLSVRKKPPTVNWRDVKATVHGKPQVVEQAQQILISEELDAEPEDLEIHDKVKDPLAWLNLPDLRTASTGRFDLADDFDIKQYLHILASSVEGSVSSFSGCRW